MPIPTQINMMIYQCAPWQYKFISTHFKECHLLNVMLSSASDMLFVIESLSVQFVFYPNLPPLKD